MLFHIFFLVSGFCLPQRFRYKGTCASTDAHKFLAQPLEAHTRLDSVSSCCSGMSPCSPPPPPPRLSGGERGLIREQRLDTEPNTRQDVRGGREEREAEKKRWQQTGRRRGRRRGKLGVETERKTEMER